MLDNKFTIKIDGTDYTSDLVGDSIFVPVIKRDKKYHSTLANFAAQRLTFIGAAYDYLSGLKSTRGGFATASFVVTVFNWGTDQTRELFSGLVDFPESYDEQLVDGKITVLFTPDDATTKLNNRVNLRAQLQDLFDFDGNAITAFSTGPHNETYTLPLTKTELPGITEIATSNCEIMLAWEVFLRLAQKILGKNDALRSDLLGRTDSEVFTSASNGRLAFVAFTNGGLIRQGSLSDYPITISLDEAFGAINQIEPIGMGIEYIGGQPFLRVEEIDYFYDSTSTEIITITNPRGLRIRTNPDRLYAKVFTGYRVFDKAMENQDVDNGAFIRSPHTERTWVTGLDKITGGEYNTRTDVAASGYLIEVLRNNTATTDNSSNLDQQNFMIVVKRNGLSNFQVDNDYVSSDLSDPTTQKNYLLMPGRCVLNHQKVFNAGLIREATYQASQGNPNYAPILFQTGQGNKTATTRIGSESAAISEDADLLATVEPIFYEDDLYVEHQLTEEEYLDLVSGNNINIRVPVIFNGVTRYGFIDQIEFRSKYLVEMILKQANPNYGN